MDKAGGILLSIVEMLYFELGNHQIHNNHERVIKGPVVLGSED